MKGLKIGNRGEKRSWCIKDYSTCFKMSCICFFLWIHNPCMSQINLLHKQPYQQLNKEDEGPNTRNWWSSYLQFGFLVPIANQDSLGVKENFSNMMFETGWRYKFKMNEFLSTGLDFGYNYQEFNIRQSANKNLLSLNIQNDKQLIRMHAITAGGYIRINFGKRGNIVGKYLDIAGNIQYSFRDEMLIRNEVEPSVGIPSETVKNVFIHLPFVRDVHYFGTARFGWNFVSIFAKYRLSEFFSPVTYLNGDRTLPNLPSLQVGIEISQSF
jgi:hypothetical protein